jgi:hypothetical protein
MGGSLNHEFLAVSVVGEDSILVCSKYEKSGGESRLSVKEKFSLSFIDTIIEDYTLNK